MSKSRYGSVEFKQVDWSGLAEGFGGGRAVLAVDVAKEDFVAAILGPDAGVRVTFKWQHPGQTLEVLECLERLAEAVALEVVVGAEWDLWGCAGRATASAGGGGLPDQSQAGARRRGGLRRGAEPA